MKTQRQARDTPTLHPTNVAAAPAVASAPPAKPLTEAEAAQLMWDFYRQHKPQLVADIRDYRAGILASLMTGTPVHQVFAPYFKSA